MKNIVIIGGGTGTFTLLSGLREYPSNNTVIVSSADDGGSTGRLRKDLGVFPPGDLRQCLVGLSYTEDPMKELFNFRFDKGELSGHTAGNIILAALEKITGNVETALELAGKMLNTRGRVIPVTIKPTLLSAIYTGGKKVVGEHNIDEPNKNKELRIKELELKPNSPANPRALKALRQADAIVFGPGDLYTSILPNLLVKGIAQVINKSKAKKILITAIMSKPGQTDGFSAGDYVKELQKYLGGKIDVAIVNAGRPNASLTEKYKKFSAELVKANVKAIQDMAVEAVAENLVATQTARKQKGDKLVRSVLRHDSKKIAKVIWELTN